MAENARRTVTAAALLEEASARDGSLNRFPVASVRCKTLDCGIDPAYFKGTAITYPSHMARRVHGGE